MDKKFYDALASSIYMNSMSLAGKAIKTDDQKIRASGLCADWKAGGHTAGEVFNTHKSETLGEEWEQTWECYQAYDNAVYPDIVPGNSAWYTFNRPLHGTSKKTARAWVAPAGAHDIYRAGEYMIFTDKIIYRCKFDTNFNPEEYAAAWEVA